MMRGAPASAAGRVARYRVYLHYSDLLSTLPDTVQIRLSGACSLAHAGIPRVVMQPHVTHDDVLLATCVTCQPRRCLAFVLISHLFPTDACIYSPQALRKGRSPRQHFVVQKRRFAPLCRLLRFIAPLPRANK